MCCNRNCFTQDLHGDFIRFSNRTLLAIVGCIAFGLAMILTISDWLDPFDDQKLNQRLWISASRILNPSLRAPMARDVLGKVAGKTQEEVVLLIGELDNKISGKDTNGLRVPEVFVYFIGSGVGGFDDAVVHIHFGANGVVIYSEITGY